jgi:acyl carrier protein
MLFFRKKKDEKLEQEKQEILHKIKPIFSKILDVDEGKVTPTVRLIEDLGADSFVKA